MGLVIQTTAKRFAVALVLALLLSGCFAVRHASALPVLIPLTEQQKAFIRWCENEASNWEYIAAGCWVIELWKQGRQPVRMVVR